MVHVLFIPYCGALQWHGCVRWTTWLHSALKLRAFPTRGASGLNSCSRQQQMVLSHSCPPRDQFTLRRRLVSKTWLRVLAARHGSWLAGQDCHPVTRPIWHLALFLTIGLSSSRGAKPSVLDGSIASASNSTKSRLGCLRHSARGLPALRRTHCHLDCQ